MLSAPFILIVAIKAVPAGYIPPLLMQGDFPSTQFVPTNQWSVSDTKLCQGLDVTTAVHSNMNPPVLQLPPKING